jgi:hypothetical protein
MSLVLQTFLRRMRNIEYTRTRMELLYSKGSIALRDIDFVYESLFLRAVTGLEEFLEGLFLGILNRRIKYSRSRVRLRMETCSQDALKEILLQGDKYLDWLPFAKTEERARLYLVGGRPFTDLDDAKKSIIKTITIIRHAIAHSGNHAMEEFKKKVIGSQSLLRGERTPAGFLRSQSRSGPNQNRFQIYLAELGAISAVLS